MRIAIKREPPPAFGVGPCLSRCKVRRICDNCRCRLSWLQTSGLRSHHLRVFSSLLVLARLNGNQKDRLAQVGLRDGIACLATICHYVQYVMSFTIIIYLFKQPIQQTIERVEGPVTDSSRAK